MITSNFPQYVKAESLPPKTNVYYFVKQTIRGQWKSGYVQEALDHCVIITAKRNGTVHKLKVAYEDIRLVPKSPLLRELNKLDMTVRSSENKEETESEDHEYKDDRPVNEELTIWSYHPRSNLFIANTSNRPFNQRSYDVFISNASLRLPLKKDVGDYQPSFSTSYPISIERSEQEILQQIQQLLGDKALSESKLEFAPQWIIKNAKEKERMNYESAIDIVNRRNIPRNSNIISSHHFFTVNLDGESNKLKLKCRIVPLGNRDAEKEDIRSDSSTAQFSAIRSVLSLAAIFKLKLATIDISKAYLQSGELEREIYMRPPDTFMKQRGELWKLKKPAYSLVESGRLWQLTIEPWMIDEYKLKPVPGLPQIFFKRDLEQIPCLVIAKVVDDLLIAGKAIEIKQFKECISRRFQVGRFMMDKSFVFYRIHLQQNENFDVIASMSEYMTTIHPLDISRERRKQHDEKATENELKQLLRLTGRLNFIGHGCLPVAAFAASYLQQEISNLKVSHLKEANSTLKEVQQIEPKLLFKSPNDYENPKFIGFSDAAQGKTSYGQTGYTSGIAFKNSSHHVFHAIDWQSSRQNRVSFSSIGAEILAAAASEDRSSLF